MPWLGNLHQPDPKWLHAQLEARGQALGPTYTFKLGPKRILVTSNIEIAPSALKDRPGRFRRLSTIEPVAAAMGNDGVRHGARSAARSLRTSFYPATLVAEAIGAEGAEKLCPQYESVEPANSGIGLDSNDQIDRR